MSADYTVEGYQLLEQIGQGDRTEVWRAIHTESRRHVALKVIPSRFVNPLTRLDEMADQLNFLRERQLPEAISLYDYGASGQVLYFATELVDGYTVADWIESEGKLAVEDALNLAECVALVLQQSWNDAALMHGSLSPDNVMIDRDGNVRIADLGLAEVVHTLSHRPQEDSVLGSAHYVSPRQALGSSGLDFHADIYALGAVLWHAVTGEVPFGDLSDEEARHAHVHDHLADPREARPGIPTEMIYLIEKMMAKELSNRFSSWDEVVEALDAVRDGVLPPTLPIEAGTSTLDRMTHFDNTVPMKEFIETIQAVTVRRDTVRKPLEVVHAQSQGAQYARRRKHEKTGESGSKVAIGIVLGGVALVGLVLLFVAMNKKPSSRTAMTGPTTTLPPDPPPPGSGSAPETARVTSEVDVSPMPKKTNTTTRVAASSPAQSPPEVAAGEASTGKASGVLPMSVVGPDIGLDKYIVGRRSPKPRPTSTSADPALDKVLGPSSAPAAAPEVTIVEPPRPKGKRVLGGTKGATLDVLAGRPEGQVLWQLGKLNGLSTDMPVAKQAGEQVVVATPAAMVRTLAGRQSVAVTVPALEKRDVIVRIALDAPVVAEMNYQTAPADVERQQLSVAWNDRSVWRRWFPAGHSIVEVFIPAAAVTGKDDVLVIRNGGLGEVSLDAVWIEKVVPGAPLEMAVEGAYWQSPGIAQYLSSVHAQLPALPASDSKINLIALKSMATLAPPASVSQAAAEFQRLSSPERGGEMLSPARQDVDAFWQQLTLNMVRRQAMPVIELDAAGDEGAWTLWAQRYGAIVAHWILVGNEVEVTAAAGWIRARVPRADISYRIDRVRFGTDGVQLEGVDSLALSRTRGTAGARTEMALGKMRGVLWSKGYYTDDFKHWLMVTPEAAGRVDIAEQRQDVGAVLTASMQWWMAGGRNLIVTGGARGGSLFPLGASSPALSWQSLQMVLPLTVGRAERLVMNVVPTDATLTLSDTYWVATENDDALVTAVLAGGAQDEGREVMVAVPVPWTGPTVMRAELLQLNGVANDPTFTVGQPVTLDARPTAKTDADSAGMVITKLRVNSAVRMRFAPEGASFPELRQPAVEPEPLDVSLVKIHEKPLPPIAITGGTALRGPDSPADRLSGGVGHEVAKTVPGAIEAYKDISGQVMTVAGVTPWGVRSDRVTFPVPKPGKRPNAVRLLLDTGALEASERVAFWMRVGGDSGSRLAARNAASVILSTGTARAKVQVPRGSWGLYSIPVAAFLRGSGDLPEALTIIQDATSATSLDLEVHGFVGLTMPEGTPPVLGYVAELDGGEQVLAVVGKTGVSGEWRFRVGHATGVTAAKGISVRDDLSEPEAGKPDLELKGLELDLDTGRKTAVVDSVHITYDTASQIVRAFTSGLRSRQKNPSTEVLKALFPSVDWAGKHSQDAVVLIKLVK